MNRTTQIDQTDSILRDAPVYMADLLANPLVRLGQAVGKAFYFVLTEPEKANARMEQMVKDDPEGARRLMSGAIVLLEEVATAPEHPRDAKGKFTVVKTPVADEDQRMMLVDDYLEVPYVTLDGASVKIELLASDKDQILADMVAIIGDLLAKARREYDSDQTHGSQMAVAYLMDIEGALRSGDLYSAMSMTEAMGDSSSTPAREYAGTLLRSLQARQA